MFRFNITTMETMTTIKVGGLVPGERYQASVTSYIGDVSSEKISYLGVVAPRPVTDLLEVVTTATEVAMEFRKPEGMVDTVKVVVKMNNSDVAFDSKVFNIYIYHIILSNFVKNKLRVLICNLLI